MRRGGARHGQLGKWSRIQQLLELEIMFTISRKADVRALEIRTSARPRAAAVEGGHIGSYHTSAPVTRRAPLPDTHELPEYSRLVTATELLSYERHPQRSPRLKKASWASI